MLEFFGGIIDFAAYCYVAIITHRVLILGADSVPKYGLYRPASREFVFAGHFIGITIISSPVFLIISLIPNAPLKILLPMAAIVFWYVFCRVALVFPAIAIGRNWSYTDAWLATKNFKLISILSIGVFPLISSSILLSIANLINMRIIISVFTALSTVIIVAVLSSTYQYIEENNSTR